MGSTEFGEKGSDFELSWSLRDRRWRLRRREIGGFSIWVSSLGGTGSIGGGEDSEDGGFSMDLW